MGNDKLKLQYGNAAHINIVSGFDPSNKYYLGLIKLQQILFHARIIKTWDSVQSKFLNLFQHLKK